MKRTFLFLFAALSGLVGCDSNENIVETDAAVPSPSDQALALEYSALKAIYEAAGLEFSFVPGKIDYCDAPTAAQANQPIKMICTAGRVIGLSIQNNDKLQALPPEIGNLAWLRWLDVKGNTALTSLPPEIGKLTGLLSLNIEDNTALTSLPPEIGNLSKLQSLHIRNCPKLASLPDGMFDNLGELLSLELQEIGLTTLPPAIGGLTKLHSLMVGKNKLTQLPDMQKLHLHLLLADNNLIRSLPPGLHVDYLFIDNNQLDSLPSDIAESGVEWLSLSKNNFKGFPTTIVPQTPSSNTLLTKLDLSDNAITTTVPASYDRLSSLKLFNVSRNKITDVTLPGELRQRESSGLLTYKSGDQKL